MPEPTPEAMEAARDVAHNIIQQFASVICKRDAIKHSKMCETMTLAIAALYDTAYAAGERAGREAVEAQHNALRSQVAVPAAIREGQK